MARVEQLYLMTPDLPASRAFYERAVGLEPAEIGESSVAYETAGSELKLQADFDPGVLEAFNLSPPVADERGQGLVAVLVLDEPLERVHERLEEVLSELEGDLVMAPREVPWGGEIMLLRDPAGYVLEIRGSQPA